MYKVYRASHEFNQLSQKIAEAIESVTKIDVTIMDAKRDRIAATGKYLEPSYGNIGEKSAFVYCLNAGEVLVIEDTGNCEICRECSSLENCIEKAEVCVPISWNGTQIGVIGLIAFDDLQKKTILENRNVYINFVQKMASLLEAKYSEIMAIEENKRLTQIMKRIANSTKRQNYLVMLDDADELKQELIKYSNENCDITFDDILGVSQSMREVKEMARKVALTESSVLICGESGTGKELFARAIHHASKRSKKPFIAINCGAIPDQLLESEVFGYERGAFSGAHKSKAGKFEIADGGTIFLDEIGELPLKLQVKLLRVLQEKEICRLGSNNTKKVDVRIISATNANLEERIQNNLFREDLYFRLNILPIVLPPLRENHEDIIYLANHFLQYFNIQFEKEIKGFSKEAMELLLSYKWPGNVRELQNVMEFAVCLETRNKISEPLIRRRLEKSFDIIKEQQPTTDRLNNSESEIFISLLDKYKNIPNKDKVERICSELNISRATFYRRKKEYLK
jgi:transcriptional regulator with PAS, ATPase and Fis domain